MITNYRYTIIKVDNRVYKKVKDYREPGDSLPNVIGELIVYYYQQNEGKDQQKNKLL